MAIIELLHPPLDIPQQARLFTPDDVGGLAAWHVLVRDGALAQVFGPTAVPIGAEVTPELRAAALGYSAPAAVRAEERPLVVGLLGAAWVWLGGDPPTEIEYLYHLGRYRQEKLGVSVRETVFGPDEVGQVAGVWVTSLTRTVRDVALWCPPEVAVPTIVRLAERGANLPAASLMLERPLRLVGRPAARETLKAAGL